jgi:hypothetical protein
VTKWQRGKFCPNTSVSPASFILPTAPSSFTIRDGYSRPNSGRRAKWTQSNPTPKNTQIKSQARKQLKRAASRAVAHSRCLHFQPENANDTSLRNVVWVSTEVDGVISQETASMRSFSVRQLLRVCHVNTGAEERMRPTYRFHTDCAWAESVDFVLT